ncbi:hypothetical protein EPR50_G00195870 [Perca flavescens]|uniref:AIG1-type G domain-containing protein n=1 Tax=Perca flavescens TaxID=8167 RepID=A0A484C7X9_PERFV|nr:hypothetical protein EPR50_G00195870 [Perca flavescens]
MKPEIMRCITECAPGPHAFLIVIKVEKFTEHEQAVITKIKNYFSDEVFTYATVLFTHGDQLSEGQKIKDCVRENKPMSDLVKKCGDRCHVIDNKYWKNNQQDEYRSNQFQVKELLNTIDKIVEANQGSCYTNEMLQAVEEVIQKEEEAIRRSSGNMSEEEIREQARLDNYFTAAILWPVFQFDKQYQRSSASSKVIAVAVLTALNFLLYVADLAYTARLVFVSA